MVTLRMGGEQEGVRRVKNQGGGCLLLSFEYMGLEKHEWDPRTGLSVWWKEGAVTSRLRVPLELLDYTTSLK